MDQIIDMLVMAAIGFLCGFLYSDLRWRNRLARILHLRAPEGLREAGDAAWVRLRELIDRNRP